MLPSNGWDQGQVTCAKMANNLPHLCRHPQKKQNQKYFFQCKLEDLPSPEGLDSSQAQTFGE